MTVTTHSKIREIDSPQVRRDAKLKLISTYLSPLHLEMGESKPRKSSQDGKIAYEQSDHSKIK
jgi:hypothetical protein